MAALSQEAAALRHAVLGYRLSQCIVVAAEFRIADLLVDGPRTVDEIAAMTGSDCSTLYRVMRLLASEGIFVEDQPRRFALTPLAEPLCTGSPSCLRDRVLAYMSPSGWGAYGRLGDAVRSGRPAFEHAFGTDLFSYLEAHAGEAELFNRAMAEQTAEAAPALIQAYPFPQSGTFVDLGGGLGALVESVVRECPGMSGWLFDQPHVVEAARHRLAAVGLDEKVKVVGGSFFEEIPAGCDLYALKHILHDWDDDRCRAILTVCRKAMSASARLLIIEVIVPPGNEPLYGKYLDLSMLVLTPGGRERTQEEYRAMLAASGLRLERTFPTMVGFEILEAASA
ncbi:methyltransferase [Microvirga massiliensis]|uniref:methyltransferase n=1 Tax=Microvirga massiliensis TaxID=1033741 RepID=UPI00062B42AA|nr:methyltransferase [Microvirga massiliensis]